MARASQLFLPTLRDAPADADAVSHKLLVRGGFIRQVTAGVWTFLPLGWRVHQKVVGIIREEMDAIGGQEVHIPALLPREPYEATGRWDEYGDGLFRLQGGRMASVQNAYEVNVREAGSLSAAVKGQVKIDSIVRVLRTDAAGAWAHVRNESFEGWMSTAYLQ